MSDTGRAGRGRHVQDAYREACRRGGSVALCWYDADDTRRWAAWGPDWVVPTAFAATQRVPKQYRVHAWVGVLVASGEGLARGGFRAGATDIEYGGGAAVGCITWESFGQGEFVVRVNDELDHGGIECSSRRIKIDFGSVIWHMANTN